MIETSTSRLKILDFDVECRPMSWYGGDFNTKEITAIAWGWADRPKTKVWLLEPALTWDTHQYKKRTGLEKFIADYEKAEMVTGHYIRGFDLPLINAACFRLGLRPLAPKLTEDTKGDLMKMSGLSKAQQNMAAYMDLVHEKQIMNTHLWEVANALVAEGRKETRRRVVGDVDQHKEFRGALASRWALARPKVWYPYGDKGTPAYSA